MSDLAVFESMLVNTFHIVKDNADVDDSGGPVANWEVVYADVPGYENDRYPKLHGDQDYQFEQPVIHQSRFIYAAGFYDDLGLGNGYGVVTNGGVVAGDVVTGGIFRRVTNIWRFPDPEGTVDHCVFVVEALDK